MSLDSEIRIVYFVLKSCTIVAQPPIIWRPELGLQRKQITARFIITRNDLSFWKEKLFYYVQFDVSGLKIQKLAISTSFSGRKGGDGQKTHDSHDPKTFFEKLYFLYNFWQNVNNNTSASDVLGWKIMQMGMAKGLRCRQVSTSPKRCSFANFQSKTNSNIHCRGLKMRDLKS